MRKQPHTLIGRLTSTREGLEYLERMLKDAGRANGSAVRLETASTDVGTKTVDRQDLLTP